MTTSPRSFLSHAADLERPKPFHWIAPGLAYGGDYNPEQWSEEVWRDDMRLMRRAGVNLVSLGIFSWGMLEVADDEWEWGWLDRILDLLHENGIGVDLATPTAAPPMWLFDEHPEIATVDATGVRTSRGGRLGWSPSSAVFRSYALRIVRRLAERYGSHPALRMWHVSNEIGNENARCYSDETALAWQAWLERRYGTIDVLNSTWGTAFWGHRYRAFSQVMPPREARTGHSPALLLDFERFTSDALLGHYRAERDLLRTLTPEIPITTNFMIQRSPGVADYSQWAHEVDLVANDHYTTAANPQRHLELAFSAERTRGVAGGEPWLLMEHSTGAVNWQAVNRAKSAGELRRDSLTHVAKGADGVMFFQWRQSSRGSEQLHSAMVPHAGADSQIFRDVCALGDDLAALAEARGSVVERAKVALIFDHDSAAAWRSGPVPSALLDVLDLPIALYAELSQRGIAVDVLPWEAELDGYDAVVVPTQYLASPRAAEALADIAERGGHVLVSYFSGIVDETNAVMLGGYPGAFRELLGVRSDEFFPLLEGESIQADAGWTGTLWSERVEPVDAEVLARASSGALVGAPVLTRRRVGAGSATYLATRPDAAGLRAVVDGLVEVAGLEPIARADAGLALSRRVGPAGSYLFAVNNAASDLRVDTAGTDLLTGEAVGGSVVVPAGGVRVVKEQR